MAQPDSARDVGARLRSGTDPAIASGNEVASPLANAAPDTHAPPSRGDSPIGFDLAPFLEAAGTVGPFDPLEDVGYGAQLLPIDTQLKADTRARDWASDAKQVYLGWGFWKSTLLAQTQHVYYSPAKKKKLKITFKLVSWKHETSEELAPKFGLANKLLKGTADVHSWNGKRSHQRARSSGYTPTGRNEVGVLIHPIVIGPLWVWLDNEDHQYPLMAVKAHSGEVVRDGLEMAAIRYMFSQN